MLCDGSEVVCMLCNGTLSGLPSYGGPVGTQSPCGATESCQGG